MEHRLPYIAEPVRKPVGMPRSIGALMRTTEVALEDGTVLGDRNTVDENGRLKPLHPRPWHSYRTTRRRILRPVFQRLCKRRIDPAATLAFIQSRAVMREMRANAIAEQAWAAQLAEIAELARMKRTKTGGAYGLAA